MNTMCNHKTIIYKFSTPNFPPSSRKALRPLHWGISDTSKDMHCSKSMIAKITPCLLKTPLKHLALHCHSLPVSIDIRWKWGPQTERQHPWDMKKKKASVSPPPVLHGNLLGYEFWALSLKYGTLKASGKAANRCSMSPHIITYPNARHRAHPLSKTHQWFLKLIHIECGPLNYVCHCFIREDFFIDFISLVLVKTNSPGTELEIFVQSWCQFIQYRFWPWKVIHSMARWKRHLLPLIRWQDP